MRLTSASTRQTRRLEIGDTAHRSRRSKADWTICASTTAASGREAESLTPPQEPSRNLAIAAQAHEGTESVRCAIII